MIAEFNEAQSIPETMCMLFEEMYAAVPLIVKSPGRINIIGEHTDYNNGFVLPAAIDKCVYAAVSKRDDDKICLYASEYRQSFETSLSDISSAGWANYVLGVVAQLVKRGFALSGFNMVIHGNIPIGAGLSSSAAVECSVACALNEMFALHLSKIDMVKIARAAEHEFAGVQCGIMDMFASTFGKKENLIKLDCRSLDYEYVPLALGNYKLVLFNTNVKHSLASSAYNERLQQCEQGVAWIGAHEPAVSSLRDATMQLLKKYVQPKDALIYRRCKYVVQENERVVMACKDLYAGNLFAMGQKMFATHQGLSADYEVSCKELDLMVNIVKNDDAVLGARVMGGGFGGCTINLIRSDGVERIVNETGQKYLSETGLHSSFYGVSVEDGMQVVKGV